MGVLACDRIGCDNVMCDLYSEEFGYICGECLIELKQAVPEVSIRRFMTTLKSKDTTYNLTKRLALMQIDEEFKEWR